MQRTPQRISLSLSQEAYSIIELDMEIFQTETNLDGFINKIVKNFKETSNASISLAKEREREKYIKWIKTVTGAKEITAEDSACLDRLIEGYANDLKTKMNSFDKGIPLKPRIHNKIYDNLRMGKPDFQEDEFYPREGRYIKAILEEYSTLPFLTRESIYFKDIIDDINAAISLGSVLKFEYTNRKQQVNHTTVRPYKIASSSLLPFNYLLALPLNAKSTEDIHPYRISRITGKIEKYIQDKGGIQYLSSEDSEVTVALSEQGYKLFKSILHLRPKCIDKHPVGDKWILMFNCAEEQIKNYFFQFGKNAEIMSPASLRQEFAEHYISAAEVYNQANK